MAELPVGEVIERRRGGPGVLALLMLDATRSRFDGHIRVERASNDGFLGNLGIIDGMPIMSLATDIHSSTIGGKDAMEKCLHESAMDDAKISVHEGLHVPEAMDLHPYSRLLSSDIQNLQEQPWWSDRRHQDLVSLGRTKSRWTSIESEFSREGAESIPFEESRQVSVVSEGPCFAPGQSWLVDDEIPDSVLGIASNLVSLGRPLLVFSRLPPERLRSRFAIHESSSVRLTERPVNKWDIGPSLEGIMRKIEDFFFANPRAVVVIDGLEFLIGLHGFDRVYDFIRNLTDLVAESDDLLLCPIDGLAMSPQERALLQREMEMLDTHTAALWGAQGAKLAGHPFIIHAMTTVAEPRIPTEVSTPETNFTLDSEISQLPEPVEDIRPDIGTLMNQWKSESTILPIEEDENEIDEFPSDEIVEEIVIQEPEDFDLPEWAIEPSSNREIEELPPSIPLDNDVEEIKQDSIVPQEVVLTTTSSRPNRPIKTTKVKRVGPKSATIDHKPKSRVRRKNPPQEHQIRTDGLREAAERWREIVEQSNQSIPLAAIPSSGKEIPEFRKIQNSSVDSSADILRNSREIDGVWMPKGLEEARRHEIVHSNSRKSQNSTISRDPPSTAREFASASHKQRRDFTALKTSSIESTELPDDFYDRLALLVEKGENIGEIMSVVERSPSEALQLLEGMEGSR